MKISKHQLRELIRQTMKELNFGDKESFEKYKSKHKMRPSTKVNIGGKETTVGKAAKKKATKQDVDSDMYAQDTWDRHGDGEFMGHDPDDIDDLSPDAILGKDEDDLEDPAGGRGDAWMHGPTDDEKERPLGGKEAEEAYHKADRMMKKYAGVDIKKAEYWAKEKKKAADAMLPEHAFSEMFKRMENR